MTTVVINAPQRTVDSENKKSFDHTFATGIGEGYALSKTSADRCHPGSTVVLLSKDERRRAEGTLVQLIPVDKARNGMQRYDLHIAQLVLVRYAPERLNRNGVAVRD